MQKQLVGRRVMHGWPAVNPRLVLYRPCRIISVAPVTSWRFYDTIYTERFMRTPQENPDGYDLNSPFNYPELLKGDYLLIHGSGDDNVHLQNTMRMVEALVQANKTFEWMIYPDKNHGIYGGNTRLHLYNKMTNFILTKL